MKSRAHVIISGRVQGVWYRASTRDKAEQLGLTGWVKNTFEGKVEAVFEGEENTVKGMINWCHEGPTHAQVSSIKVEYKQYTGEFDSFNIVY